VSAPRTAAPERAGRDAYRDRLLELMVSDPRTVIVDSDTGLFDPRALPEAVRHRYLNIGIAEQNLIGVAAGLCRDGFRPWVTTMATFASTRALEAIKLDIAYPNLPVRIVGTHAGLSAGHLGPTHHGLEDVGILRMLPNLTVVVPADADQMVQAMDQAQNVPGPIYFRLGRKATAPLPASLPFAIGRAQSLRPGPDLAIIGCGPSAVAAAAAAGSTLATEGVQAQVINLHTVKPLDQGFLTDLLRTTPLCVTVEEHWRVGGIGSALAELIGDLRGDDATGRAELIRIGVSDRFVSFAGNEQHLLAASGIDDAQIVRAVRNWLTRPTSAGTRELAVPATGHGEAGAR
jgi:transketolase